MRSTPNHEQVATMGLVKKEKERRFKDVTASLRRKDLLGPVRMTRPRSFQRSILSINDIYGRDGEFFVELDLRVHRTQG